jgi:hypothetical protein
MEPMLPSDRLNTLAEARRVLGICLFFGVPAAVRQGG